MLELSSNYQKRLQLSANFYVWLTSIQMSSYLRFILFFKFFLFFSFPKEAHSPTLTQMATILIVLDISIWLYVYVFNHMCDRYLDFHSML